LPRKKVPPDLRALARSHTVLAVRTLGGLLKEGVPAAARVAAAMAILDRGWGKPSQAHKGEDENLSIIIRQFRGGEN